MSGDFEFAEAWRPKPGDTVKGSVTEVTTYAGGDYGSYPIVNLKTGDGEVAVHAFHTALRNQLAELNVQPGDEIGILYQGKQRKRDGSGTYEGYRCKRLGVEAQRFDWGQEREWAEQDPTPESVPSPHEPLEEKGEADVGAPF